MSIIYTVVARGSTVLAEYSSSSGNFTQISRRILEKIPQQDGKMSYVYDKFVHIPSLSCSLSQQIATAFIPYDTNRVL